MHNEALKSSLLCGKKRRVLLRHTNACVVEVGTDESEEEKPEDVGAQRHGVCTKNEMLIDENLYRRVL